MVNVDAVAVTQFNRMLTFGADSKRMGKVNMNLQKKNPRKNLLIQKVCTRSQQIIADLSARVHR